MRSQTKGGGTRARRSVGTTLPKAIWFYNLYAIKMPRPDSPRCSYGRQPHPSCVLFRTQLTRSPALRGVKGGAPGCRTRPGTGKAKRKRGHQHRAAFAPQEEWLPPNWVLREERPRHPGAPPSMRGAAAPLPRSPASLNHPPPCSLLAGVINRRVQTADQSLAGSGGRVPAAAVEPRLGAGRWAGQPDPASGPTRPEARANESTSAERSFRSLRRPRKLSQRPAAAAATADCGWAGGGVETRAPASRRGGAEVGAGPSPGQQGPPHKGGGASGPRGCPLATERQGRGVACWWGPAASAPRSHEGTSPSRPMGAEGSPPGAKVRAAWGRAG